MAARKMSTVTEIGIFTMGLPVMIGLFVALFAFSEGLPGQSAADKSRGMFIAIPLLSACGICFLSGILLLASRKAWAVYGCIIGGTLIPLAYLGVVTILTGSPGVNLITAVFIAVPVLLVIRGKKALDELHTPPAPPPPDPPLPQG
jgi:hypothetical protein